MTNAPSGQTPNMTTVEKSSCKTHRDMGVPPMEHGQDARATPTSKDFCKSLDDSKTPLRIGLESARANRLPMVVLWALALTTVLTYYFVPGFADLLEPLAQWQSNNGSLAAFVTLFLFCGLIPGMFLLSIQSLRPQRPVLTVLAQSVWCGLWGMANNGLYTLQCRWFGDGTDIATLLIKTAFDQFVWTVFILAPCNATFFFWLARDFSFRRLRCEWPKRFVHDVFLPNLISNWIVWIPVLCFVYAFPLALQIQVAGIASSFWVLMCLQIGKRSTVQEHARRVFG